MVQAALVWRILGVTIVSVGYGGSVTGGRPDAPLVLAAGVTAYHLVLLAVSTRRDLPVRFWWCDAVLMIAVNLALAALLPDATLLREYHDLVWPAWLGVVYVVTVLGGGWGGTLAIVASVPIKLLMTLVNGIPLAEVAAMTVLSRVGWAVVGVALVTFVLDRARRWAALTADLAGLAGEASGLERGSEQREQLHRLVHTDGLGALDRIRQLASDESLDTRARLERIGHLARATDADVRRYLQILEDDAIEEGTLEARVRDRILELTRRFDAPLPELQSEVREPLVVGELAASTLVNAVGEAVVNVHKHAGPDTPIRVIVRTRPASVVVVVIDRGPGFDPAATPRRGLEAVERALRRVGGSLDLRAAAAGGMRLEFQVPRTPDGVVRSGDGV